MKSRPSMEKRRKELQRQERKQRKAERREQRKKEKLEGGGVDGDEIGPGVELELGDIAARVPMPGEGPDASENPDSEADTSETDTSETNER